MNKNQFLWITGLLFALTLFGTSAQAAVCDADADGDVDKLDLNIIRAASGDIATEPDDPRDFDGNGIINSRDLSRCSRQCDLARCAIISTGNLPPIADDDSYSGAIGNTQFAVVNTLSVGVPVPPSIEKLAGTVGSVLTGDTDPDVGQTLSATAGAISTSNSGAVSMNADGTFSYTPPLNFNGDDSFTYEVCDSGVPQLCDNGTVTITVTEMVWYVDDSAAGDGRSHSPLSSLSSVNALSSPGDIIFIYEGNQDFVSLKTNQQLIGQPSGLSVAGNTLVAGAGNQPVLQGASDAITLGMNNTIKGVSVNNTTSPGGGIVSGGSTVGILEISNVALVQTTNGAAVDINNTGLAGVLNVSIDSVQANNSVGMGVRLNNNTGSTTFGGLNISNTADIGLMANNSGTLSIGGLLNSINTTSSAAVNITNTTIGAAGLNFVSISANGSSNGIVLNNTGISGGLMVIGDGTTNRNASGGTLQNMSAHGIVLIDTQDVMLSHMSISNIDDNAIEGLRVTNLNLNHSSVLTTGDADDENALNFVAPTIPGNSDGIIGTLNLVNTTIENFTENALEIENFVGSLTVNITNSNFDDNHDAFGNSAIQISSSGTAGINLNVSNNSFNDIELDIVDFLANGTTNNDVQIINNTSTNGGGPDSFPAGGGITLKPNTIGASKGSMTFNIQQNILRDMHGSGVVLVGDGDMQGRIGGSSASDGNTISNVNGDGVRIDHDQDGGTHTWTLLVQNNHLGDGNGGILTGIGDDGIQILNRDGRGTLNLTIEDNVIANTDSEGVRLFTDEDLGLGSNNPTNNIRIVDNAFTNIAAGGEQAIELRTRDTAQGCFHMTGNDNNAGGSPGFISLNQGGASMLQITQASIAALSAANNGATITDLGAIFNGTCTNPALPVN